MTNIEQKRAEALARIEGRRVAAAEQAARVKIARDIRRAGEFQVLLVKADMPLVRVGGNSLHELREDVFDAASNTVRFDQYAAAVMGGEPFAVWH